MKKNTTLIVLVVLAIGGLAWYLYQQRQKAEAPKPTTGVNASVTFNGTNPPTGTVTVNTAPAIREAK